MAKDQLRGKEDDADAATGDFASVTVSKGTSGSDAKVALDVKLLDPVSGGSPTEEQPATVGGTTIIPVSTSQVEIAPVANQIGITITNLSTGNLYVWYSTGVTTSSRFLRRNDELPLDNYAGSVFLIRSAGSSNVQIDRELRP